MPAAYRAIGETVALPDRLLSSCCRLQNYRIILNQPNISFYFSILLLILTYKYVVKHKNAIYTSRTDGVKNRFA